MYKVKQITNGQRKTDKLILFCIPLTGNALNALYIIDEKSFEDVFKEMKLILYVTWKSSQVQKHHKRRESDANIMNVL